MGIEDRLREVEDADAGAKASAARREADVVSRAATANQLLRQLAIETLPMLEKRNHPKCLEIISVSVKAPGRFDNSYTVRVSTGRTFRLLQKSHVWGKNVRRDGFGINEAGELIQYGDNAEGRFSIHSKWIHPENIKKFPWFSDATNHYLDDRAIAAIDQTVKSVTERAGCGAAAVELRPPCVAYGEKPRWDPDAKAQFYLSESGRLMFGTGHELDLEAEEWWVKYLSSGDNSQPYR